MEVSNRTSTLSSLTSQNCIDKFDDLKRRFGFPTELQNDTASLLVDELRKLRVDELRREVHQRDVSIVSLEMKVKRLEEDREKSLKEKPPDLPEKAKTLPENTTNENKLILYGLFKQATVGPVNTSRPGIFNMRDRAKWDGWKAVEGKSKEEAMSDYITKVKQLLEEAAASA